VGLAVRADAPNESGKPIAVLLRELGDEIATLVRQEFALAKAEAAEKGRTLVPIAVMGSLAALLGLGAFGAVTICVIAALALAMHVWLAALIVTVVYGAAAAVLGLAARKRLERVPTLVPEQTAQTVKEDVEWAKMRAKSGMR
jgi:uncharacterized membrane protein YqjE